MLTLYGLDVKITPDGKPILIEINGRGLGIEGFVRVYGDVRIQEDILSRMAEKAGDKGIYRTHEAASSVIDILYRLYGTLLWFDQIKHIRSEYKGCSPQMDWHMDHKPGFPRLSLRKSRSHFGEASEKLKIDLFTYSSMIKEGESVLTVQYPRGIERKHRGKERVTPDNVGLIWPLKPIHTHRLKENEQNFVGPTDFDQKLVNPFPRQNLLRTKSYLHELFRGTEFSDYLPKTELFGAGLTKTKYDIETSKFVKKPNFFSQGYGLRIYRRNKLKTLLEKSNPKEENKRVLGMFEKAMETRDIESFFVLIGFLKRYSSLIQEFVPSKPIRSHVTGKEHDGCMRVVVADGQFVDGYWRLSPKSLDGYESIKDLRRMYGANLSQGALPQRISESDREIVKPFAEKLVKVLEERIDLYTDPLLWLSFEKIHWLRNLRMAG